MTGFDYNTATPDEIRAEAERREHGRKGYRGEEPPTPAQAARRRLELENQLQQRVIQVYVRAHCKVRSTSQPRKAKYMTPGGADLQIFSPLGVYDDTEQRRRVMWYHEVKLPAGKYSDAQLEFAADCREAGIVCVGGGVEEARAHLESLNLIS